MQLAIERPWQEYHITQKDGKFIAWDESGMDELGEYDTYEKAFAAIDRYAETL